MVERVVDFGDEKNPAWCHVRLVEEGDKPLLIVCSQMFDNPGGSVTNFLERIQNEVLETQTEAQAPAVDDKLSRRETASEDDLIDAIVAAVTLDVSYPLRMSLKLLARAIRTWLDRRRSSASFMATMPSDHVFWVEHYPAGLAYGDHEQYALVSRRPGSAPEWEYLAPDNIALRTGYALGTIVVDPALLRRT